MAAVAEAQIRVRPLIDSRPPDVTWRLPAIPPATSNQPRLDLVEPSAPDPTAAPAVSGTCVAVLKTRWLARPRPDLPDAAGWSALLAPAVMQVLLDQRPIAQLNRWLADDVLAEVTRRQRRLQRRRRGAGQRAIIPVTLRSIRVQHPSPEAAEVAAHLVIGPRSTAIALRLEATAAGPTGGRWLCTALDLGPPAQTLREDWIE
ncbi:MAG TPA: Rv3235 family protein [Propionibacteriaceae bacterium]|nr:Rv3235 family protein [Propionibacteriaceae bacterium]